MAVILRSVQKILQSIAHQSDALKQQFEYHILANHLFSNAKALVFVGVYLDGDLGKDCLLKGLRVLKQEMEEQFLQDGAHFELSPMYHALFLEDLLDLVNIHQAYDKRLVVNIQDTILSMFDWLTFPWLMENLEWVVSGMIISLLILLLFPLLITIEFRKLSKKEDS